MAGSNKNITISTQVKVVVKVGVELGNNNSNKKYTDNNHRKKLMGCDSIEINLVLACYLRLVYRIPSVFHHKETKLSSIQL